MSKRLYITSMDLCRYNTTRTWRAFCASEGDWFYPIIDYEGSTERPLRLRDVVRHAVATNRSEVLERLRRKAENGMGIRIDGKYVSNAKLRRCLENHGNRPEPDTAPE
ncbi:MAG: hypothetical protein GC168_14890 [Candidatus Hydrogenedens sp.]|nr:hypothetical protein [Candidatus Hydrogenedens sp.]